LCLAADTTEELVVVLEVMSDGGKRGVLVALQHRIRDRSDELDGGILMSSLRRSGPTFSSNDIKLSSLPHTTPSPVPDLSVTEGDDPFGGVRSGPVPSYCAGFGEGK
jgi:hypothetical protein